MATALPLILLPPSEGKASGGDGLPWTRGALSIDLDAERARVIRALAAAMKGSEASRSKLLDVKGKALVAATAADRVVAKAPTVPAIERYTGVLYDAIDHRSLSAAHRRRLDGSVVIFSGLWGAVTPTDPIPDYRLKMGAAIAPLGKLSTWWREPLSARLTELATDRHIWNLLPNEHSAAWDPPAGLEQWTVRFLHRRNGALTTVSHDNKSLKGALVRYLLANPSAGPEDLAAWKHPAGYRLDTKRTERRGSLTLLSLVKR
jgi:cytoplasmic iron level regulating protein YaaA (DUF328/UPF0246 family)